MAVPLVDEMTGAALAIPARSRVVAQFDRLLDPTYLEDLADAGAVGKAGVVSIEAAQGQFQSTIVYTPNGDKDSLIFSPYVLGVPWGPSIVATPSPTLPSGTAVTVTLSKDKIKSKAGEAFVIGTDSSGALLATETLSFTTQALAVDFAPAPDADAGATCGAITASGKDSGITLTFNNAMSPANVASFVTLSAKDAAGADVPSVAALVQVTPDEMDPGVLTIAPKAGDSGSTSWPGGVTVTVTVTAQAQDAAGGKPLGTPSSACFVVGGSS